MAIPFDLYDMIKEGRLEVRFNIRNVSPPHHRFWAQIDKEGPIHPVWGQCWSWTGNKLRKGYGRRTWWLGEDVGMNRRGFFRRLLGSIAAAVIGPVSPMVAKALTDTTSRLASFVQLDLEDGSPVFNLNPLPLPVVHADFGIPASQLMTPTHHPKV